MTCPFCNGELAYNGVDNNGYTNAVCKECGANIRYKMDITVTSLLPAQGTEPPLFEFIDEPDPMSFPAFGLMNDMSELFALPHIFKYKNRKQKERPKLTDKDYEESFKGME